MSVKGDSGRKAERVGTNLLMPRWLKAAHQGANGVAEKTGLQHQVEVKMQTKGGRQSI